MALIIKTDGTRVNVQPENGSDFSLQELWDIVGGYIEIVNLRNGQYMVTNEEGKLCGLPYNEMATYVARMNGAICQTDYIVGNVLVCDTKQIQ